ncbi:hypothetical protein HII31_03978 [Pseudocercospora fuligena]|uniref:MICOS complex subunit MIC12 n=1 Tax=Pseudocercospora fuligena TaxID=685502 RepID=A0A8H6RLR1_9PEZI|nr:hypothetical protein HII31_03978 [Pseudocercospora fuligena]
MGFTTGLLGGFTLTATVLYLSINLHTRNRVHQAALLHQQSLLLDNIVAPQQPLPPPTNRQVQAGLLETAKDKWNAELERNVKTLQQYDWTAAFERVEESAGNLIRRAFDKGKEGVKEQTNTHREQALTANKHSSRTKSGNMTCNVESRLKSLAPELRNTIAELALGTDREDGYTDITKPWPSITQADIQIRGETYDMFLATTDFVAHVKVRNGSYDRLLRWLDMLGKRVRLVKSLTIICDDEFYSGRRGEGFGVFGLWTYMGAQIRQRGLTPSQLRLPHTPDSLPAIDLRNDFDGKRALALAVIFRRIYLAAIAGVILKPFQLFQENQIQQAETDLISLLRERISDQHFLNYIAQCSDSNVNFWLNLHEDWQKYASLVDEQEKERLLVNREDRDRSDYTRWGDLFNQ